MKYQHLFFDLDHTLWDFEKSCAETLGEIFEHYEIHKTANFKLQDFIQTYLKINDELWKKYDKGHVSKEDVRNQRFAEVFKRLGEKQHPVPDGIEDFFIRRCPQKPNLIPYAKEILNYLSDKYHLHIVTNGFSDTQGIKIRSAGIEPYFTQVFHSETCGYKKPDKRFFDYIFSNTGSYPEQSIIVGDNLDTDIKGARNAGMDHIFFNRKNVSHKHTVTYEINCLSELKNIF